MFDLVAGNLGRYRSFRLVDVVRGAWMEVIPEVGALVNRLVLAGGGVALPLMWGYATEEELATLKGFRGARLLPFANRIRDGRYSFRGHTH